MARFCKSRDVLRFLAVVGLVAVILGLSALYAPSAHPAKQGAPADREALFKVLDVTTH
ncbi:MAG: hypothetical protein Q3979_07410 [Actinomycetaceae bacterium]|nr:hypothetical protein [Actinomycetaceae bacterium]